MKKNLGNGFVKKSIIVAMSVMLLTASPALNVAAADDVQATQDVNTSIELTEKEEALVDELHDGLLEIGDKYNTTDGYSDYDAIDDAKELVEEKVTEAIESEVTEANTAANEAEDAAEDAKELASNVTDYKETTDELLNADQEIVESVEGNTNGIVETITKDGDILLNVEDENGQKTQVKVQDYTQEKADVATNAANEAQEILNNITSSSNIEEERAKIDNAVATAEAAKDEAETAYNSAKSVLVEEIKRYNAYAAKYGYDLYEYTDENGKKSTPAYTEEELAGLSDLTMSKDDIAAELDDLASTDLKAQLNEIKDAEHMVKACEAAVNEANGAIEQFKNAEETLVTNLESIMSQAEEAMKTATGTQKDIYQAMYDAAKAALNEYTKPLDQTNPNGVTDSYEARFDYAVENATDLATEVEKAVENANNELYGTETSKGAVTRYNEALAEYNKIKAEYDNYVANKAAIDANFVDIKKKLKNAEAAVNAAQEDLVIAIEAVNTANKVKEQFESTVAKPSSGSNNSSSSSSSVSTAATPATVTLEDVVTPLTASIPDEQVPLTEAIVDEATPLADSVPKTGDASAAAGAVGATGVVSMLGALFMNLKKRTLR